MEDVRRYRTYGFHRTAKRFCWTVQKTFSQEIQKCIFIERTLFLTENRLADLHCKPIFIYCPLLQTTMLFAVPLKAAAKPSALRGQYERRLLVAKPPPAIHCRYCKIVDFAIEPSTVFENKESHYVALFARTVFQSASSPVDRSA